MRIRKALFLLVIITVVLGCAFAIRAARSEAGRHNCHNTIRALAYAVKMYRDSNADQFPPDLETVALLSGATALLHCHGTKVEQPDTRSDFIYIDWSHRERGSDWSDGKYPLIYDARLRITAME